MEAIDVVFIMVGLLLILVLSGVRVAFAAAFVGLLGLTIHFAIFKDKGLRTAWFIIRCFETLIHLFL